jgi:predicted nucleic acid-binding protein
MVFRERGASLCRRHPQPAGGRRGRAGNVLWYYEASAVLAREQNRGTLAAPKAGEFLAELKALRIVADAESAARVFTNVHRLALDHRLTSYDPAYLELALRHGLPLATLDDELIRASKVAGVTIL